VRGSLIDVFPMGSDTPFRIDMLDRDVDSIRRFDPDSQRSLDKLDRIELLPARETPLNPDAVREFRRRYRLRFTGDLSEQAIYRDVSSGIAPGGIEYFLPLFFDRTSHLFEYLPPDSVLVVMNDAASGVDGLYDGIVERHEQLRHDRRRPILDPAEVYLTPAEFQESYAAWPQIQLHTFEWPPETAGVVQNFPSVAPAAVRSTRAPSSRRRNWRRISRPAPRASCSPPSPPGAGNCCSICFAAAAFKPRFSTILRVFSPAP